VVTVNACDAAIDPALSQSLQAQAPVEIWANPILNGPTSAANLQASPAKTYSYTVIYTV